MRAYLLAGAVAALLFAGGAAAAGPLMASLRGIRNNNPFNLRPSSKAWRGQVGVDADNYLQFDTAASGLRAGFVNLRNQQKLHGLRTVASIITKYAPATDHNDTASYIFAVCTALHVGPDELLDLVGNPAQLRAFGEAVIAHEEGVQPYTGLQLATAVATAQAG